MNLWLLKSHRHVITWPYTYGHATLSYASSEMLCRSRGVEIRQEQRWIFGWKTLKPCRKTKKNKESSEFQYIWRGSDLLWFGTSVAGVTKSAVVVSGKRGAERSIINAAYKQSKLLSNVRLWLISRFYAAIRGRAATTKMRIIIILAFSIWSCQALNGKTSEMMEKKIKQGCISVEKWFNMFVVHEVLILYTFIYK